ncbi:EamA/RhaT family transporter [Haloferax sp. Atlit-4N]|uniref:DMT(Drug/metabolite transporter) superfamily permease n=1 Tax=Haloferax gibbonsii (strain ATCC 33959 / DSM 4427 / JCM 8863 / NBRC 102184 / NCIMB 2188 / Ma 2.38) TaxID=1227459 RepID=M0HHN2_HALGM|nr:MULTISPECIES: DMT family transporter [Haloferax]ELZ84025.1 DMT(drug/metabolite transporter) superfamily permease [Haloferax gibbonsii ATCC 33959]RDZ54132.1 EamA/RhaT family transporter [Haloferax sp. Atlit-4N]
MSRARTAVAFLALSAVWGSAFLATDIALRTVPPAFLGAVRFDVAALLLFAVAIARGDRVLPAARDEWRPILAGGAFSIGAHHALLFSGQVYVPGSVASVLLGIIPLATPTLTRLTAARERLSAHRIVGLVLGFLGLVVIANPDPENLLSSNLVGAALVFGSAVAFALGAVLTHDSETEMSLLSVQAWMMLVGAVTLHVTSVALPWESAADAAWTQTTLVATGYLAVVAGAGGFLLYFWLLDRVGPIEVSLLEYVIPIFAALADWTVLGRVPTRATVAGFALIFAGFLLFKREVIRGELRRIVDRRRGRRSTDD